MKKILLVLLLSLTLLNCEDASMSGSKVNSYTPTDPNPENMQETMDTQRRGFMALTLSEYDSSNIPSIEAGSSVEITGSLFEFDTIDSISTIDPYTSSTVANGTVYIVLRASGSTVTASFTATIPTWNPIYQGYYKTATLDRFIGKMVKSSSSYTYKTIFYGRDFMRKSYQNINSVLRLNIYSHFFLIIGKLPYI